MFTLNRPQRPKREEDVYLCSFFNFKATWGLVVESKSRRFYFPLRVTLPSAQQAGWAQGRSGQVRKV